jgi:D-3-phosphoglycerate dehydrogenase
MKEVIATPHLGSSTSEAYEAVAVLIAEQVSDYLLTGAITNAVNMPSVSAEDAPKLRPYLTLASQLGGFAGQTVETAISEVVVEYSGHVATLNTKPLTAVILAGLLKPMNESVNMVNAPIIAKARDICVSEVLNEVGDDYQTLIRLVVVSETQTRSSVAGTLFSGSRPRLVGIDDIPVEAELGRNMLSVTNRDKPGLIGALGTLLGEHGINIATFNLGRTKPGGDAILLAQVDQPLSDALMAKVRAIPQVVKAKVMRF